MNSSNALPSSSYILNWQTVELDEFATIVIPNEVKLYTKKCQNIPVNYEIDDKANTDNAVMVIQVLNIKKKIKYGGTAWWGNMSIPGSYSILPNIGALKLRICQKNWRMKDTNYSAIKARKYDLYFAYGYYGEDGSINKTEIYRQIKFTKQ